MKLVTILGARPQFIKAAAVSRAIAHHNQKIKTGDVLNEIIVHTGQHYDENMSEVFFRELLIPNPDYFLDINGMSYGAMTGQMIEKIEQVLLAEKPYIVLVYGDTNSTLAGALAAIKLHIPVAHVESGLRSFNKQMPEEINRVVTDHISTILYCPTKTAVSNLKNEGFQNIIDSVGSGRHTFSDYTLNLDDPIVLNIGDVMYDAFLTYKNLAKKKSTILSELGLVSGQYCLATVHRQGNVDDPLKLSNIISAFEALARSDCPFILPVHPRTRNALKKYAKSTGSNPHFKLVPPAKYLDMIALEVDAKAIFTDSGGVQKEAFFSRVPCITLRDETEWIETVEAGWNFICGTDKQIVINTFNKAIKSNTRIDANYYGEGRASHHIIEHLISSSV